MPLAASFSFLTVMMHLYLFALNSAQVEYTLKLASDNKSSLHCLFKLLSPRPFFKFFSREKFLNHFSIIINKIRASIAPVLTTTFFFLNLPQHSTLSHSPLPKKVIPLSAHPGKLFLFLFPHFHSISIFYLIHLLPVLSLHFYLHFFFISCVSLAPSSLPA